MFTNPAKMATNLSAGVLALNILFLFLEDGTANTRFVFKANEFQNVVFPAFERKFLTFAADALQNDTIADLFVKNIHRGSGRRVPGGATMQGQVPSEMSLQSLEEMLKQLKVKVDKKYSDAVKALLRLKEEFERNMSSSFLPRPRQLQPCCFKRTGGPPSIIPSYRYEARYRDLVNVSQECVGKSADFARTPFTLRADDAFRLMKVSFQSCLIWSQNDAGSHIYVIFYSFVCRIKLSCRHAIKQTNKNHDQKTSNNNYYSQPFYSYPLPY